MKVLITGGAGFIGSHTADALPLRAAELPPLRGAVAVERLQGGASWLLQALEQRDAQIQGLRLQLAAAKSEIAAVEVIDPTVSRSGDERGRRGRRRGMRTRARGQDEVALATGARGKVECFAVVDGAQLPAVCPARGRRAAAVGGRHSAAQSHGGSRRRPRGARRQQQRHSRGARCYTLA